jgi:conjugal transfer pilus assembly protein TraI
MKMAIMKLIKLFKRPKATQQDDFMQKTVETSEREANVNRYPPFDRGFPVDPVDKIIQSQSYLIDRIKVAIGMSNDDFERLVMTVIRNYADYIHLLPATSKEHHRGAGGLFRLGLEVAFYSLQSASGVIFSGRESSEKRRILQPKWCYATFVAGLCVELYRPVTSLVVVDNNGNEWPQLLTPLTTWLKDHNMDRYYIRWNEAINGIDAVQRHSNAAYLLNQIIPQHCLQYMNAEGGHVITAMTATITGAARANTGNHLYDIVMRCYENVVTRDIKANPELYGKFTVGAHMEPHVIDAMRSLYSTGQWKVNQKGGRLWYSDEGLFCIWALAAKEIRQYMVDHKLAGIPENEDTLAEMLMNGSILLPNRAGGPIWDIMLPETGKLMRAVRLADPSILLLSPDEKPIDFSFIEGKKKSEQAVKTKPVEKREEAKTPDSSEKTDSLARDTKEDIKQKLQETESKTKNEAVEQVAQPQPSPAKPNIAAQQETSQATATTASGRRGQLFETLSESSRLLLGAILDDYLDGSSDFPVFFCAEGFAISVEEFRSKGISEIPVLKEIGNRSGTSKRWLVTEAGSSKQTMSLRHGGKQVECFVLNNAVAKGLGFLDKNKG